MDYDDMFRKHSIDVARKLKMLHIHGVEVTQAIQYYRSSEHLTDSADQGADNRMARWGRIFIR